MKPLTKFRKKRGVRSIFFKENERANELASEHLYEEQLSENISPFKRFNRMTRSFRIND